MNSRKTIESYKSMASYYGYDKCQTVPGQYSLTKTVKEGYDSYNCNVVVPSKDSMSYGQIFNRDPKHTEYNGYANVNSGYYPGQASCGMYDNRSCNKTNTPTSANVVGSVLGSVLRNTKQPMKNNTTLVPIAPTRPTSAFPKRMIPLKPEPARVLSEGDEDPLHGNVLSQPLDDVVVDANIVSGENEPQVPDLPFL